LDILNKSFVKQYLINYVGEIFGNKDLNDDDIFLESLKEQVYKLNIVSNVKDYVLHKYKDNNRLN